MALFLPDPVSYLTLMNDTLKEPGYAARLGSTALPEVDDTHQLVNPFTKINELTNISHLSNAQLHELNQNLLNSSTVDRSLNNEFAPMSALREEYENGAPLSSRSTGSSRRDTRPSGEQEDTISIYSPSATRFMYVSRNGIVLVEIDIPLDWRATTDTDPFEQIHLNHLLGKPNNKFTRASILQARETYWRDGRFP
ncbi:hypothetical protein C8J56DRAFT_1053253 [Mycena floridula]|nr:hypothetical protein C8J56DRAFT_1053253 [Mycena floridula]